MLRRASLNLCIPGRCFLGLRVRILLLAGNEVQNSLTRQFSANATSLAFRSKIALQMRVFLDRRGELIGASYELRNANW